jgi:hypothetical protein
MSSSKQILIVGMIVTGAVGWLCHPAGAQDRSRCDVLADKPLHGNVADENDNAPPELKKVMVYVHEGDTVVMHTGNEEVEIHETTPVGMKGKTYFVVTGDVNFGYPGKDEEPKVEAASSVRAGGAPVLTAGREGSIEIEGNGVRVDFDGPDVRVSGARTANVYDGSRLFASNCKYAEARDGGILVATDCDHVDVRTGSKATITNCKRVSFMTHATGTASGCKDLSVRDATAECSDCETVQSWGEGKVTAEHCGTVETRGSSEVIAKGARAIEAWPGSKVFYTGSPQIKVFGPATVRRM